MTNINTVLILIIVIVLISGYIWMSQESSSSIATQIAKDLKTFEPFAYGGAPRYAKLGGGYNTQLFSPCISRRCAGGPYMFTSDPYMQAVCQGVTNSDLAQKACGKAFHGQPVHFDYTSLSNGAWDNALCNTTTPSALCVL